MHLKDYSAPDFFIPEVELTFDLDDKQTIVSAKLQVKRNMEKAAAKKAPLRLDGEDLKLVNLSIDGHTVMPKQYNIDAESLTISDVPDEFVLQSQVAISPVANKTLDGLYKSQDLLCTQCEAFGFRRITYFLDRPDVMAKYTVTLRAGKDRYPVLLSNGNLIAEEDLAERRHSATWRDDHPKPSYLFALVAGDMEYLQDHYMTKSGRRVTTRVYYEKGLSSKHACRHAMASLHAAMHFDEKVFARECDVDTYMIVAINDFNCKAMENKGLNFFSNRFLTANPRTSTDEDYLEILDVIAHEYFHNWSGNRVTCRDWFQLSLKEGLTVFRDQIFTEYAFNEDYYRICEAEQIFARQFKEDAGPLSHPVKPTYYEDMNNFYTVTVYNKGAEVIYMLQTLLGKEVFNKAIIEYFTRFDGKAVTIEDLLAVMAEVGKTDLTQFQNWYNEAGTPVVTVKGEYDAKEGTYKLHFKQTLCGKASDMVIPIKLGLLDDKGNELQLNILGDDKLIGENGDVFVFKEKSATLTFENIEKEPVPSLLRDFSAPVKLDYPYSYDELLWLMVNDTNIYNRWAASRKFWSDLLLRAMREYGVSEHEIILSKFCQDTFQIILTEFKPNTAIAALLLELPSVSELVARCEGEVDIDALHAQRKALKLQVAKLFKDGLLGVYNKLNTREGYEFNYRQVGGRRLKNLCLDYLAGMGCEEVVCLAGMQYKNANNITDKLAGLRPLVLNDYSDRHELLADFYEEYRSEPLLLDKWFVLQAEADVPNALQEILKLMEHQDFALDDPNRARAVIRTFAENNLVNFHAADGSGYKFLTEQVLKSDKFNPQLAASLVLPLAYWQKMDPKRQSIMKECLREILASDKLSKNLHEVAAKSLSS